MKKLYKILIASSLIFVLALGITSTILWGPIFLNLNSREIETMIIKNVGNEEEVTVAKTKVNDITIELRSVHIYKRILKCNCAGNVKFFITYVDGEEVEFDGFYLHKSDKNGRKTGYVTNHFAPQLSNIYAKHFSS